MATIRKKRKEPVSVFQRDPGPWSRLLINWLATLAVIMVFGLVMLFSASYTTGYLRMGDSFHYIKQQALCMLIGLGCMFAMSYVDHRFLRKMVWPGYLIVLAMLAVTLTMAPLNGCRRWIRFGGFTLQSSEVAKFEMILLCSSLAAKAPQVEKLSPGKMVIINFREWLHVRVWKQLVIPVLPLLPVIALLALEPHMSGIVLTVAVVGTILLLSGSGGILTWVGAGTAGLMLETLLSLLPQLIPAAVSALMTIVNTLIENLPLLIEAAVQLVSTLVTGIADALPTLIPAAVQAIVTIVQGLVDSLPMLLDAALQLITGLAQGLLDAIPVLIAALPEIINGIITFLLDSIPQIIETGIQLLTSLVTALPEIITAIVEAIPKIIDGIITAVLNAIPLIIQAGIDLLISLIQALPQIITTIVQAIPQIISGIVNALVGNIDKIIMAGVQLFIALIENLPTIIVEIVKAVPQIIAGIVKAFGSLMYKIVEIGGNIVKGLWSGITQLASWLWDKVSGWISSIWDGICDFFGIHSPSKEMAWVGEMLVKGLAGSIDDNGDEAVKAAEGMAEDINGVMGDLAHDMQTALPTDFDVNGSIRSAVDGVVGKAASAFTIALNITNFNNYSSEDIRQLTNEVMETANQFAQRKGVVFA